VTETEFLEQPVRRPRLWLRSLTSKLVVGVVALVLVLVTAIGSGTYFFLRSYLLNRLDQQLSSVSVENTPYVARCVFEAERSGQDKLSCFSTGPHLGVQEWIAALQSDGTPAYTLNGPDVSPLDLTNEQADWLADHPGQKITVHSGGTDLRVTAQPGPGPGGYIVATGLSTDEVDRTLHRLVRLEILIGAAAMLIAFAATSWGVQRSLRNLYTVTGTAQEVAAELSPDGAGLDRRVPVVEEGTEVGQLAESMNTLLAAVETQFKARVQSERRMRQFLADASHELRTPLTSIRGYAELARMKRAADGVDAAGADDLDRIESEGTRMSRLVDDLLLLARGDADGAGHLADRVPVDLADVLDDAVNGSRAAFPDRPIDVEIAELPAVVGDRDQLLRVVRNLITNAAVHTAPGRPILVRGAPEAFGVAVTVSDGGPGLPPEQAAHVFERFWRADKARTRARGGTGLGLSIVSAIVAAHGGSVRFDSDVQRGSTVTVWLPAAEE
jgi:two-component system OmpR family sensor kinase